MSLHQFQQLMMLAREYDDAIGHLRYQVAQNVETCLGIRIALHAQLLRVPDVNQGVALVGERHRAFKAVGVVEHRSRIIGLTLREIRHIG